MSEEKKNRIIGAIVSGGFHTLLLLAVFLLLASAPPVEKEEEGGGGGGGNPAGEGQGAAEGEVGGAIIPVEIAFAPMPDVYVGADISAPTIAENKPQPEQHHQTTTQHTQTTQTTQTTHANTAWDNAMNALNGGGGGGHDSSTGGGTGGTGGGTGGGNGGGDGPGSGSFSGFGTGSGWSLKGRGMNSPPSTNQKPTAAGKVILNVLVDKNGKVLKADVASSTLTQNVPENERLAKEAAMRATFSPSQNSLPQQGQITIVLKLN